MTIPAQNVHLEKGADTIVGVKLRKRRQGPVTDIALDLSYSHLDYTSETIPTALVSGGALLAFASSVYKGVNIFGDASPFHDFYVFGNIGIVSAKFTNHVNGASDANGNTIVYHDVPVPYTPTANMSFGAYFLMHIDGMVIQPRLACLHTGSQYAFDNNNNMTAAGAFNSDSYTDPNGNTVQTGNTNIPFYGILNFSASIDLPTSWANGLQDLKATFEVGNLTAGGLDSTGTGAVLAFPGAPRS